MNFPLPLIVISAPSGGGKSTVIRTLREQFSNLCYSISATTRSKRAHEKDGEDYFFWAEDHFRKAIDENKFIEWAEVHGEFYGTLWSEIQRASEIGRPLVLDLDVQGGLAIKEKRPDATLIFLIPPSLETLESRLRKRGTESETKIKHRLNNAEKEIEFSDHYDYQVVNRKLRETVDTVSVIIQNVIK